MSDNNNLSNLKRILDKLKDERDTVRTQLLSEKENLLKIEQEIEQIEAENIKISDKISTKEQAVKDYETMISESEAAYNSVV